MAKALVLLSGGLDSMLAARILMEQGIEVTGLSFNSNFFCTAKAKKVAEQLGIKLLEVDFSDEHFKMVKNPKHGYGKNMNPCIDCHALMFIKAKEIMEKEKFDFVATGEVLGQRPMSQHKQALDTIDELAGLKGRLVRPMSAKLLNETEVEKSGKLIRGRLLNISGRSRARQLELVKKYGIKEYSSPGGGCLLTDPEFSEKLLKMIDYWPEGSGNDIELLKNGRVFWFKNKEDKNILVVVGREQKDNEQLGKLVKLNDILIEPTLEAGPTTLVRGLKVVDLKFGEIKIKVSEELKMSEFKFGEIKSDKEILELAKTLTGYYAVKSRGKTIKLKIIKV